MVKVKILKPFGDYQKGDLVDDVWKNVKTWINAGTVILVEQDEEMMSILKNPNLFMLYVEEFKKKIVGEEATIHTLLLNLCGVFVENINPPSFNLCLDSESGSGKDYVADTMIRLFPPEQYEKRTRISPTAFNYWHNAEKEPEWTWNGKICYLEDVSNSILNSEVFKVMCSADRTKATITVNNKPLDITVNGKPVMVITTASAVSGREQLRRWPRINLDESKEQTRKVMEQKLRFAKEGKKFGYDKRLQTALKYLTRVKVRVPWADELKELLPYDHVIMRTQIDRFVDYIRASAALHQYQRERDKEGFVLAEAPQDYEIARKALLHSTSNRFMIPLTKRQRKLLEIARSEFGDMWFSVRDLSPKVTFVSEKTLYGYMDKLQEWFFNVRYDEYPEGGGRPKRVYQIKPGIDLEDIPVWQEIKNSRKSTNTSETSITSNTTITSKNTGSQQQGQPLLSEVSEFIEPLFERNKSANLPKNNGQKGVDSAAENDTSLGGFAESEQEAPKSNDITPNDNKQGGKI